MDNLYKVLLLIGLAAGSIFPQSVYYSQNFEGTVDMVDSGGGWGFGTPTYTGPTSVPEGSKCAGTILNGDYSNSAIYRLTTPSITLPNSQLIYLSFYEWYSTESSWDYIYLEIEQNNSGVWNSLRASISGSGTNWSLTKIDLSSYRSSNVRIRFSLTSDGSVTYPGWYIDQVQVYSPVTKSLTVNNNGSGTTTPTGTVSIESSTPYSISATPNLGYRFSNWNVESGSATISNPNIQNTTVQITSDATIKANFTAGTVYSLTSTPAVYNFTTNNFEINPGYGIRFQFAAPAAGTYTVVIDSSYKYFYDYGTSSSFSSYIYSTSSSSRITYSFTALASGEIHYFKVVPYSSTYYSNNISAFVLSNSTLTLTTSGSGIVTPSSPTLITNSIPYSITATPSSGYKFSTWTIVNGNASIANPLSQSTTVQLSGNATIRAEFIPGTVYQITTSATQYNYTSNYYEISPTNGVRFKFVAPSAGSYSVTVQNVQSHSNYLYYYGRDSLFSSYVDSRGSNGSSVTYSFYAANTGESHYFRVYPSSSSYNNYNFSISYSNALSLTISNDGHGTTSPSGIIGMISGELKTITATPSSGYRFTNWTIESGSPTITSTTAMTTTVSTTGNAAIKANFNPGTVYSLSSTPAVYNFTTNNFEINPGYGIRFQFAAPAAGTYTVVIDSSYKYFYDYGTNSSFSSYITSTSSSSRITYNFTASAAGEVHYFKVAPYSSSYYANNISAFVLSTSTLTLMTSGSGTVYPSSPTLITNSIPYSITATPSSGYKFSTWTRVNGNASIANPSSQSTTVQLTGNATIRAEFIPGTVYQITTNTIQYNYTNNYFDISPSNGVRFKFVAPSAGGYSVTVQNVQSHSNYLYYYGRDSLFYSYIDSRSNGSTVTYTFYAAATGETHYFIVYPSSSSYNTYDFNISYSNALSLNISNDGHGTTSPSGTIGVLSGESKTITATPSSGYRFTNWTVESGSPVITNTTAMTTTVSTTGNAAIKASFNPGTVYDLTLTPTVYNFTTNCYEIGPNYGVRFKFRAQSSGNYSIVIDSSYKYLYFYGTDSTFSSYTSSQYGSSRLFYTFTATAGRTYYFNVSPYTSTYYASNFSASVLNPYTLIIVNNNKGRTFPSDTLGIFPGIDTTLTAIPNGGYKFSSWNVLRGNATFSRFDSTVTRISVASDTVIVRASFVIDPNTRPDVEISDLNISSHPDICVTASVTDTAGRSITGLDSSNFILTQDSDTLNYQLTTVSKVSGVSVALVLDISGSMSGTALTSAKDAALQFVRSMSPLDRCAIVSFDDQVTVEQVVTSDTSLLIAAINRLASRNNTAIRNGAYIGVQQLLQETNTRAVIIYSDGGDNSSTISQTTVIDSARNNHITIYSIGIGSSADYTTLRPLADSTGGYYTPAPSASDLARIYAQIKNDVESQYILCYQSPDQVFNGDTHTVVISVNTNNHVDKDTVYWDENNMPPVIILTSATNGLIGVNQPAGLALTISADITDDGRVDNARLFYRTSNRNTGAYTELPMTHVSGTLYQAIISAPQVIYPGIDFYILASDNYHLIGRSPNVLAPETQPYVIPVANEVPLIVHTPAHCFTNSRNASVSARITDNDGTFYAVLYYKKSTETFFTIDTMVENSPDIYTGTIPSAIITSAGVDYYIRAVDNVGAAARYPASSAINLPLCSNNNPPVASAGADQVIYISNGCSASAHLDGSGSTDPDGDPLTYTWKGTFPGTLSGVTQNVDLPIGTNRIELIVTDVNGSSDTDTVNFTVRDTIDPVPNLATLPVIRSLCQVTVTTRPTATDNCSGTVTATTTDPLTYVGQGTHQIHWTYSDGNGNTSTQLQTVDIHDTAAPVPLINPLPVLKGECALTVTSFPKAADYCNGTITAKTSDPLTFTKQGTYQIQWAYTDSNGNSSTQLQTVTIHDTTAPIPLVDSLPILKGECELTVTSYPKASDNCSGTITAKTSDSLTFKNQGIYQIHWTYADSNGNSSTQLQTVIIHDTTAPVPLVDSLPVLKGECELSVTSYPKATDHCNGEITATTSDPLTYNTQGTHLIHWVFNDGNGNTSTQFQTVIIHDTTAPVPLTGSLPVLKSECALNVTTYPQASDICAGTITATTTQPLTFNSQGTHQINWIYNDGNGNSTSQTQTVIIHDSTAPVPEISELPILKGSCSVTASAPFAIDNCAGQVKGTTQNPTEYHEQGVYEITWSYSDANGNISTQKQQVVVKDTIAPLIINKPSDTLVVISALKNTAMVHIDSAKGFDSCSNVVINAVRSDGFDIDSAFDTGTTSITWKVCDLNGNCDSALQNVIVRLNHMPELKMPFDAIMREGELDTFVVSASDSDKTIPQISIVNPNNFIKLVADNGNALVIVNPGCNDHGLYTITIQASDGIDSVRSDFKLRVEDIDFPPVFDSIGYQQTVEMQPFNLQVNVRDCDGTVPWIRIINAPSGSNFIDNHNGSATFSWTPGITDNGYYVIIFETGDGTTTVRDTIVVEVIEKNFYSPELKISSTSLTTSVKLPITILATGSDKDGTPPLLKASSLPTGSHFNSDGKGAGVFTWTPIDTGKYSFTISAIDCFDTTVTVDSTITIYVTDENITGPTFSPCNDTTVDQNTEMVLTVRASDPDGTIPRIYLISNPPGVSITDNKDGTAKIIWNPDCDVSGKFKISAGAADQSFSDTLDINVTVRDINCAPVITYIPDISAGPGEPVTIPVSAFDPDNNGTDPILSANCDISNYTFVTSGKGSGEFRCLAPDSTGIYPVTFYATDGILSDSQTVKISVNKKGSLKIIAKQKDARIYAMPAGCFKGRYLGRDSVIYTAHQGNYSFEIQCNSFRAQRISCSIIADSTKIESISLKPSVPLMFAAPETLKIDTNTIAPEGPFSFIDMNGDGIEDLVFTKLNKATCFTGLDKVNNRTYKLTNSIYDNILSNLDPLSHCFVDWNNKGQYNCIYSDKTGKIFVIDKNQSTTLLVNRPGEKLFPIVLDIGNDGKKDLLVHSEGHGIFIYRNTGTDSFPSISSAIECVDPSGKSFTGFKGVPLLADLDNNGCEEFIISSDNILKIYSPDSVFSTLNYKEDLNCGGTRVLTDSNYVSSFDSPLGMPKLVIRSNGKMLIYYSHLLGDVNRDSVVDIQDISAIAKNLDISESDPEYKAAQNLMLSNTGDEQIDIQDISKASKCWELKE
jgi:VWFA-related protein